jgi:ribosome biogenesis GTPase
MSNRADCLAQVGWRPFFSQQLTLDDFQESRPARVASVQRSSLRVLTEDGELDVTLPQRLRPNDSGPQVTVGDWVMVANQTQQVTRVLERQSLISRVAAGKVPFIQPIAANIDTLFVVTSCNSDFNTSRLERYLALAHDAQVTPVIVLTKMDLCPDPQAYVTAARACVGTAAVETVNATDESQLYRLLEPWLGRGQTVAFAGSSGVGKSTLINSLLGSRQQETQEIREADSKGRHTTTGRHLFQSPCGAWLVDTPGMRELKIGAVPEGIRQTFVEIESLSTQCRFRDCRHHDEPGCAVRKAIEEGRLEARRLDNFQKLSREARRATLPRWELHRENRSFGQMARAAQKRRKKERHGEPD